MTPGIDDSCMNERLKQDTVDIEERLRLASMAVSEMRKSSRKSSMEEIVQASGYVLGCMAGGYGQALFKFTGKIIGTRFAEKLKQILDLFLGHVGRGCSDAGKLTFGLSWGDKDGCGNALPAKEKVEEAREEMAALMKQIKKAVWMAKEIERQREEMVRLSNELREKEGERKKLEENIAVRNQERCALSESLDRLQEELEERRNAVRFTQELLDMMNVRVTELKADIASLDLVKALKAEQVQVLKKVNKKLRVEVDQLATVTDIESTVTDTESTVKLGCRPVEEDVADSKSVPFRDCVKSSPREIVDVHAKTECEQSGARRSSWRSSPQESSACCSSSWRESPQNEPSAELDPMSSAAVVDVKRREVDVASGFQQYMEFCDHAQRFEVLVGALKHFSGSVLKAERKRVFLSIAELASRRVLSPDDCVQAVKDVARYVEEFGQAQGLGEAVGYLLTREILPACALKSLLLCMRVRWVRQEFGVAMLKTFHSSQQGNKKSRDKELVKFCSFNGSYFWVALGGRECPRLRGLLNRKGLEFLLSKA